MLSAGRNRFLPRNCIAGFDISRSGVSKIEARLSYVDDKTLLYLVEVLKVQLQELFPTRPPGNRIYDFIEKLETTRFRVGNVLAQILAHEHTKVRSMRVSTFQMADYTSTPILGFRWNPSSTKTRKNLGNGF